MKTTCCSAFLSNVNLFIIDDKPASKLSSMLRRRGGKRKESLQLHLRNLNICIEKVNADWQRWWHHYSWHMFFKVCLHSRSLPLCTDWRKSNNSVDREAQGNWRWTSNSTDVVASCPSFSRPAARVPWRARRLFDEICTSPPNFIFMDFKSYFPVLIFPWNYLPCVCNLEYNFNTVLHCTHAKLQGIWYGYICLWQHSFHGNGKNSFLK